MISTRWSSNLAYAIGLLATDGNLSKDGRHLNLTSKDTEQIQNFKKCLKINNKIGNKTSGFSDKLYFNVQFGDVNFYKWLVGLGLTPKKSKTLAKLKISKKYFFDFLRGNFDGDGSIYSYWDKRWASSFMFYIQFTSASKKYLEWLRCEIALSLNYTGKIKNGNRAFNLVYAKAASKKIISAMYKKDSTCLKRKKEKIKNILEIENAAVSER